MTPSMKGGAQEQEAQEIVSERPEEMPDCALVKALMEGALCRLSLARGHMERGASLQKAHHIQSIMAIIGTLQETLKEDEGDGSAGRLDDLYDYMRGQLYHANVRNDPVVLDEVADLLATIKSYKEWLGLHG